MDDKLEALKQTSIFSALDEKHLQAVAKITDRVHVKEGRILIYEGQVVTHMYMIIEGSASVKLDDKVVARLVKARSLVSWQWSMMPLLPRRSRSRKSPQCGLFRERVSCLCGRTIPRSRTPC